MDYFFYFLATAQVAIGGFLLFQSVMWLAYVRRRASMDPGFTAPRVAVLCPCKGVENGLERNLIALTEFSHQNYEIFFVLASDSDPAINMVKRVIASSRPKAHLVIAGDPLNCGEKVNNLRAAVEQLPPDFEVIVFADSDGCPGKSWLQRLTAPLRDARVGAATTMRWLIPNKENLPTILLTAWNAPILTMLSERGKNFCWGGGTAIRRSVFEKIGVLEDWQFSVSDDYSLTRALERNRHSILFVPECLTPSYVETNLDGLLEFTNRQILITRIYAEKMWAAAFATHVLYCVTVILGCGLFLADLAAQRTSFHIVALLLFIFLLAALRGAIRLVGVVDLLPALRSQIMSQSWIYILLPAAIPFLYTTNFINSLVTKKIRWRGIVYELISANQTRILP